ncbi:MAG TPA: acetate--CoA ligase family protein [Polyangiaceae bacterium]|nr:acetate--CoA ligase family protein [Polyangiaceae bacterium]
MHSSRTNLDQLFAPTSVAVVGASVATDKAGHQALLALGSFRGDVFPINPKAEQIAGRRVFPSLKSLGRPVDLVLFALPAAACPAAMQEAIECGCGGGLIVGGGFAESGPEGARIQAELEAACARSPFRLLGPNTAGFVNKDLSLTASFLLGADRIPGGSIAVVAQSAGICLTVSFLLAKLGYGASLAVGLGNAMNVDASDVLEFVANQPTTRAIALHLEGLKDGRRLFDTLRRVTPKKPVVVLTVGRSDIAEFAASHTGNLMGSYAIRTSALRQAGAVVVDSTAELVAATALLSQHRLAPKPRPGIGVLTAQGGAGLLVLDRLKHRGLSVPALSEVTRQRIERELPPMTFLRNPVDTGRPPPSFPAVLEALTEDPGIDMTLVYAIHEPAVLRAEQVLPAVAERVKKPIVFATVGPPGDTDATLEQLRTAGIYVAGSPEELADAAITLSEDASAQYRLARAKPEGRAELGVPVALAYDEPGAKEILDGIGIATPRRVVCSSHEEARAALRQLTKPVVAKIVASEILHKTEVGGVVLGVSDEAGMSAALAKLDAIPVQSTRRYLIEETAPSGLELIVGAVRDATFGPTLMVGLGGTVAEALRDTASRLAPVTELEAEEMLDELRSSVLLGGFRGSPPLDRAAVARVLVSLGAFLRSHPTLNEVEINPLCVYPQGVLALDALLR